MLARNHRIAGEICERAFPIDAFHSLQEWQQLRLSESFSDLMNQESCRPACDFFLCELYGGLDFLERDQDLEKVMPVMVRFLPARVLKSLAAAFELQAISLEFDMEMAQVLKGRGQVKLDLSSYASIYRVCGQRPQREKQILLIRDLGFDLLRLVDRPWVSRLVRLLRGPAHAAGFGKLQHFLESGLASFRQLEEPSCFIETIYQREWRAMQNLFDGKENPFAL
jgi:hypothetical protein